MSDQKNDDHKLIAKALAGDRNAFDMLVEKYYDMMYALAFRYCGNRADAEDIAHDAFIKMAENLRGFRHDSSFKTWLYRIVMNVAHDHFRKNKRRRHGDIDDLEIFGGTEADAALKARELVTKISTLPRGEKEALVLVAGQGLSHAEAAEILGCKENTISWRLHEARRKLAAMIEQDEQHG